MKNPLNDLSEYQKKEFMKELRILWTYESVSIEGNTFSFEDTHFFLSEGITIGGKSLGEHCEIKGHANGIDYIYSLLNQENITKENLFILHGIVMGNGMDVYSPVGKYKVEKNGTIILGEDGIASFFTYPLPHKVPDLMDIWLNMFNELNKIKIKNTDEAIDIYTKIHTSFVSIHPFADGNGRMVRLLSNLPILKNGLTPIIIANRLRKEYMDSLRIYQQQGDIYNGNHAKFKEISISSWRNTIKLIESYASNDSNSPSIS